MSTQIVVTSEAIVIGAKTLASLTDVDDNIDVSPNESFFYKENGIWTYKPNSELIASDTVLGMIKAGANVEIEPDGTLNVGSSADMMPEPPDDSQQYVRAREPDNEQGQWEMLQYPDISQMFELVDNGSGGQYIRAKFDLVGDGEVSAYGTEAGSNPIINLATPTAIGGIYSNHTADGFRNHIRMDDYGFLEVQYDFLSLTDTPADYSGQAGMYIRVNATEDGFEYVSSTTGIDNTDDVPEGVVNLYYTDTRVTNNATVAANSSSRHSHSNFSAINNVTDSGDGSLFLADDGTYKASSGGGIPEAPADGKTWGRIDNTWEHVVRLSGDTMTGNLGIATSDAQRVNFINSVGEIRGAVYHSDATDQVVLARYDAAGNVMTQLILGSDGVSISGAAGGPPVIESPQDLVTMQYVDDGLATKENDLGNPSTDGYVLSSDTAGNRGWIEMTGGGGSSTFLGLSDTPSDYTGSEQFFVKVNAAGDGLEFVAGSGASVAWGDITGTLSNQTDLQSELDAKLNLIGGTIAGDLYIESDEPRVILHEADTDTFSRLVIAGGSTYIQAGGAGYGDAQSSGNVIFTGLMGGNVIDFQVQRDYTLYDIWHEGNAPAANVVVADGDGTLYLSNDGTYKGIPGGITSFIGLSDTPSDYTGSAGLLVAVNATEDALEFITAPQTGVPEAPIDGVLYGRQDAAWVAVPDSGVDTFLELTDTPADYTGQAGNMAVVNATEDALEFVAQPTVPTTTDDLAEGSTNLYYTEARVSANADVAANTADRHSHANKALLDNLIDTGTGDNYLADDGTYKTVPIVTNFLGLSDTPSDYTGMEGCSVHVNEDGTGLEFVTDAEVGSVQHTYRFDTSNTTTPADGRISTNNADPTLVTELYVNDTDKDGASADGALLALDAGDVLVLQDNNSDVFYSFTVNSRGVENGDVWTISVEYRNSNGTFNNENMKLGFIYVGAKYFTALKDTPADYVGQAGKVVRVNSAENAVEFDDNVPVSTDTTFGGFRHTFDAGTGTLNLYTT